MLRIGLFVGGFIVSALWFSLVRDNELGYLVKIIPIAMLIGLVLQAPKGVSTRLVAVALVVSAIGDIVVELGFTQAGVGVFVVVMLVYSACFYLSCQQSGWLLLIFWLIVGGLLYGFLFPYLAGVEWSGALYQCIICLMMWRASVALLGTQSSGLARILAFIGALGIALNGVLYAVDLYLVSINRDLIIQLYYWGQLAIALSLFDSCRAKGRAALRSSTVES